jgi:hypothetical protein
MTLFSFIYKMVETADFCSGKVEVSCPHTWPTEMHCRELGGNQKHRVLEDLDLMLSTSQLEYAQHLHHCWRGTRNHLLE